MSSLLVSCYELSDLFKNFSRKGRWGTEESKSRNLFDLKVVDGKKPTTQHKTSPHGLDLEWIWGSAQTYCSQKRKLRPRAGVWLEVQQSLEPLLQVRSGAGATLSPREPGLPWRSRLSRLHPQPGPSCRCLPSAHLWPQTAQTGTCPRELSGVSRCG